MNCHIVPKQHRAASQEADHRMPSTTNMKHIHVHMHMQCDVCTHGHTITTWRYVHVLVIAEKHLLHIRISFSRPLMSSSCFPACAMHACVHEFSAQEARSQQHGHEFAPRQMLCVYAWQVCMSSTYTPRYTCINKQIMSMCTCIRIHTYIHTYIHAYVHTSIHPPIHPSIHPSMHA